MAATDQLAVRRHKVLLAAAKRWQARKPERENAAGPSAAFGAGSNESPLRQARFDARQAAFGQAADLRRHGQLPVFIERKIGATLDMFDHAPSEAARTAGHPVARIVNTIDPGLQAEGYGSGFLVHPELLLTNWHVFPEVRDATGAGANFGYEEGERGLQLGLTYALEPERFFVSNEDLDFALVAVAPQAVTGQPLGQWGTIMPSAATAKILVGQPINIVQYPDGGPKKYATTNNTLVDILDDGFLQYLTDTQEGSSGSPTFSAAWELVGLHHAGVPEVRNGKIMTVDGTVWTEEMGDDAVNWIANEGIRISAIVKVLSQITLNDASQAALLRALLGETSDPADDIISEIARAAQAAPGLERKSATTFSIDSLAVEQAMTSGVAMTFTGPVTINIYGDAAAAISGPAGIAEEKSLRFDPDYAGRKGYDPGFLGDGLVVALPTVMAERQAELYHQDGEVLVLPYHHYSLAMHEQRRLPMWTAANLDYSPGRRAHGGRASFGTDRWVKDPRLPESVQLLERDIYGPAHQIDLGHIVRRQDSAWGDTDDELEFSNSDTFHLTNCTPQHEAFNRASPSTKKYGTGFGIWGGFEMYTESQLLGGDLRACVLAGPVLAAADPAFDFGRGSVQIPLDFWKVVVVADRSGTTPALKAYGFIMSQRDLVERFGIEFAPGRFARFAAPLAEITKRSGVVFDPALLSSEQPSGFVDVSVK